MTHTNNY